MNGVSFIIPTWNKKDLIIKCVKLLDNRLSIECPNLKKEIIIVDNGSTDGSFENLSKLKTKTKIIILKQKSNLGFAKAINIAAKKARYEYLYLLNNDMEVQPYFFTEIIKYAQFLIQKNVDFFGISSQIFFFDPKIKRVESGKTYIDFKKGKLLVGHELNSKKLQKNSPTAYCGGGSSLINKKLFHLLGGFDYKVYIPMYCEDLDLGFIAWKKGYPSFFCPKSHVVHHHRKSSKLLPIKPDYYIHKNYLSFCLKNIDSPKLLIKLLFIYPLYLIFKKNYINYLVDNLKNIKNIQESRNRLKKIPNKYKDIEIIKFNKFVLDHEAKY